MAKVMISVPDELLRRIDRATTARGTTRSGFLRQAAERELDAPTPESVRRALESGRRLFAGESPFDLVDLIREQREERTRRDQARV